MSKKAKFGIGAGVLLLTAIIAIGACGRRSCHSRMAVRFAERGVDKVESELSLTDVQKSQFKEIRARIKADVVNHIETKSQFLDQLDDKLTGDNPNINDVNAFVKAHMRKQHNEMEQKYGYITEFYNILNADQKRILVQKVREHIEKKQGCMEDLVKALNKADI